MKQSKSILAALLAVTLLTGASSLYAAPAYAALSEPSATVQQPTHSTKNLQFGTVTTYDYGTIKLHAYRTNDVLQDECYLVEGLDGVVILESTAFKNNINEWNDYIHSLNKPIAGKLLSYHPNGWNTYADAPIYATASALKSWGKDGGVTALTNQFVKTFGDTVDTNLPEQVTLVKEGETLHLAGIDFKILNTADADYSVEIPAIHVVYRHMLGSNVHNILPTVDYIDHEIADMKIYQKQGYNLILTGHHEPEGQDAVATKLAYLRSIKDLVFNSSDKEDFIKKVKAAFPNYEGENYLTMSADALFAAKTMPSVPNTGSAQDIAAIKDVIHKYADSITNYDLKEAAEIWQTDDRTTFVHPRGNEYGWKAIRDHFYGNTMHDHFSKRHLYVKNINVQVYGDMAVAVFYWDFPAVYRSDGTEITTHGRETQVYNRTNTGWKIVHVHYSPMPVTGAKQGF